MGEEKMGDVVTCEIGGVSVLLNVDSEVWPGETMSFERWRADSYATKEPDTIAWIDSFVREGDVLYDIGANIGQYGLYAAKRLNGNCRVLAFEPEALNYARLNQNIVLNGLSEVITAYCLAITDRTGLDFFYVKAFAPGASLHTYGQAGHAVRKALHSEEPPGHDGRLAGRPDGPVRAALSDPHQG